MPVRPPPSQPLSGALLLWAGLAVSLGACVRGHTLFEEASAETGGQSGESAAAMSGGTNDPAKAGANPAETGATSGAAPWDEARCVEALATGKRGDPCVDNFKCTANSGCCQIIGFCANQVLTVQTTCDLCVKACTTDADCGSGKLCDNYACHDCPSMPCPDNWSTIIRSDCKVCVPPSECKDASGVDCAKGEVCVAGLTCLPGCKDDTACCFGNRCAMKGCGPPKGVDCLLVGCPAGTTCQAAVPAADCVCDPKLAQWSCSPQPQNTCVPL